MNKLLFLILFIISNKNFAQKNNWKEFSEEKITTVNINKTEIYKVQNYILNVVWNEKLSYSENIGYYGSYYGGIEKLSIYKENKEIQIINKIEDNIALGTIYFNFYDYNLDGYLDFTLPINSRWLMYYIFNPKSNKFEHKKSWDYLKIQKIDKKNKLILSQPSGNAFEDNRKKYKIKGLKIIEIGGN